MIITAKIVKRNQSKKNSIKKVKMLSVGGLEIKNGKASSRRFPVRYE